MAVFPVSRHGQRKGRRALYLSGRASIISVTWDRVAQIVTGLYGIGRFSLPMFQDIVINVSAFRGTTACSQGTLPMRDELPNCY